MGRATAHNQGKNTTYENTKCPDMYVGVEIAVPSLCARLLMACLPLRAFAFAYTKYEPTIGTVEEEVVTMGRHFENGLGRFRPMPNVPRPMRL